MWGDGALITLGRMRFALLGADSESVALAVAAIDAGHTLAWCGDLPEDCPLPTEWTVTDQGDVWEALLDGESIDGVIVGRGSASSELRGEQVNQLIKSGVPVLTSFPLVDSVLTYYEIDMSRREAGAVLQHYNPLTEQTAIIERCTEWIASGHEQLGAIEQVVWERPLAERTQPRVLWHFSRDVELLSLVSGKLNRLGALGSPDEAATYSGLSIQLLGKSEVPVRWQVGPVEDSTNSHLTLIAQHGRVSVEFDEQGTALQCYESKAGETTSLPLDPTDAARSAIEQFVSSVNGQEAMTSSWPHALSAMELTDTIEISLRRGRMIEVHQQQLTEQLAFKGTMSAIGCCVILLVPPLLLFLGWIGQLFGVPLAEYWSHALLVLLCLFLGVQLIPKLLMRQRD